MRVLVVNAGSSSLKLSLLGPAGELLAQSDDLGEVAAWPKPDAVGHRVVHGGSRFSGPAVVDDDVRKAIADLTELAPLHQPLALRGMAAVEEALPGVPQVACFDTAFHATLPPAAATYAVPAAWTQKYGIRRYGFHGLSHAYASRVAGERTGGTRIVSCHLGAGASLAAVLDGRSVDTTMGFTPLEGLVMATRAGTVDPGLVLWLADREPDVFDVLEHRSGLLGIAGTADMRQILARDDEPARLAFDVYVHRLCRLIGAMVASVGGLDTLVFTGGVGEHAPTVRRAVADRVGFLGVALDAAANDAASGDADITAGGAGVSTLVVTAREDLEVARQVNEVLG